MRQVEDAPREVDRRKDEFLATLVHELRNLIAPVRNALEINLGAIIAVRPPHEQEFY
jgi:signal transduction histidine kinase